MIPNIARLAHDEAFIESQHPRDNAGKFSAGGGNGGQAPQPANVSSTLTGIFKSAGFKKVKKTGPNGEAIYAHPSSGVHVKVHPAPAGKKWSSKWTSSKGGNTDVSGEGSSLAKLLRVAVEKAQAKKAEAAAPTPTQQTATSKAPDVDVSLLVGQSKGEVSDVLADEGYLPADVSDDGDYSFFNYNDEDDESQIMAFNNKTKQGYFVDSYQAPKNIGAPKGWSQAETAAPAPSLTTQTIQNIQASGQAFKELGYKPADVNGAEVIYHKDGGAKIKYNAETGDWVAATPGHLTKEGKGLPDLQALLGGDGVPKTVKNSQQVIQTQAEKTAMTEAQKKQQASVAEAAQKANKANASYTKMKDQAPHPTATQQTAITKYSGSAYSQWNDKLRHDPNFAKSDPLTTHLDSYLTNATFEEEVTVYRKVDGEYAKILKSIIFEGTKFIDRGYVSTSAGTNKWHGSMTFKITCPKGTKGAAIGKWSHHPGEQEVLLPRNSAFVVKSWDPNSNVVHVELDQSHFK